MIHPAVLKPELQRAHIARGDQLARLDAQIGNDLLHQQVAVASALAAGGAEGEVVGPEGCAGETKPQAGPRRDAAEGMAPGGGLRFVRIDAQVVHLIGDRQPTAQAARLPLGLQIVEVAGSALVTHQQALPVVVVVAVAGLDRIPAVQAQTQSLGCLLPLQGDRGAVAEHHEAAEHPLTMQLLEAEQRPKGLAGAGAGVDQHILVAAAVLVHPGAQQLDQLALPPAWLHRRPILHFEGHGRHRASLSLHSRTAIVRVTVGCRPPAVARLVLR